ncbi:MAG: sugar transferase [Firmicutes bacterium]|nr:sugar transferase [Bacillota bacterium]MCM1401810.1 sugar transferase [Bacteroides sp.]MCM1477691.1 sugar transferase [Bacteroides sp.]
MISQSRLVTTYVLADWLSTSLAVLLFNVSRYILLPTAKNFYSLADFLSSPTVIAGQILFPLGMLVIYYMSGYYSNVFTRSRVVEFTTTLATAGVGTLVIIFVALINDLSNDRGQDYRVFLIVFLLLFALVYFPRLIITSSVQHKISSGKISFPTAIVGLGAHPELFEEFHNSRMPHIGLKPALQLYADNVVPHPAAASSTLPQAALSDLEQAIRQHSISRLIVLPHPDGWETTLEIINKLYSLDMPIFVSASKLPSYLLNHRLVSFTADPLIDVSHSHISPAMLCTKRIMDISVSAIMLALTAIPMAILATVVKCTSPGPAFFRQQRVGRHRKLFTMYKLRSMRADAEANGEARLSQPGDSRITPVGHFLRKYRLDELPQFFNVLRGDMSLVGPRPERLVYVEQIERREPSHALVHRMRPGITSLAMVKYGYATSVDQMIERMKYDMIYLQNASILSDLKIMLYTFSTVFSGKGI